MSEVYITALGIYLPNDPISNQEMEDFLGKINGQGSKAKNRILRQNGIQTRYYALDKEQNSTHSNAQMAAYACEEALKKSQLLKEDVQLLATATTQSDLPIPGFASLVHAQLGVPPCELASFQSVCASAMMAMQNSFCQIKAGVKENALCVGSEFASRLFKASRFEAQNKDSLPFDTEFLRWMLSDGAGAVVLEKEPNAQGLSLAIDWIELKSHANEYPLCMYVGAKGEVNGAIESWLDYPDYESASKAGAINLKQDIRLLDKVMALGVAHFFDLVDRAKINPGEIDWLCCHYSSQFFKQPIKDLMKKKGIIISDEKWFSNLSYKGNTGSASIFIILEELLYSGRLKENDSILCMVPESGQFITSFMKLKVVHRGT